ncbi:hypothetical protein ACQJBY_042329 [Aegilops geniculata]
MLLMLDTKINLDWSAAVWSSLCHSSVQHLQNEEKTLLLRNLPYCYRIAVTNMRREKRKSDIEQITEEKTGERWEGEKSREEIRRPYTSEFLHACGHGVLPGFSKKSTVHKAEQQIVFLCLFPMSFGPTSKECHGPAQQTNKQEKRNQPRC